MDRRYDGTKLPCNRENMTKLVEALESGNYEQGRGYLLQVEGGKRKFCCLGVACDISGLGKWEAYHNGVSIDVHEYVIDGGRDRRRGALPGAVMGWLGLPGNNFLALGGGDLTAMGLNDSGMYDFNAIAARIREVYLTD